MNDSARHMDAFMKENKVRMKSLWPSPVALIKRIIAHFSPNASKDPCPGDWSFARFPNYLENVYKDGTDKPSPPPQSSAQTTLLSARATTEPAKSLEPANKGGNADTAESCWTPLMFSAMLGNIKMARALLDDGAQIDAVSCGGQTALFVAALYGQSVCVQFFLDAGADVVQITDYQLYTVLMVACLYCDLETVQRLIAAGSNINHVSLDGRTALDCAEKSGNKEIAAYLESIGGEHGPETPPFFIRQRRVSPTETTNDV